jgi:hypothetical protein
VLMVTKVGGRGLYILFSCTRFDFNLFFLQNLAKCDTVATYTYRR